MEKSMEKLNPQRQRQRFSKEFKLNAVKLLKAGQKPGTQITLELGIRRNQLYKRAGTLWEWRYRATVVDSEQYLLTVMRYFELEPVQALLTTHPRH